MSSDITYLIEKQQAILEERNDMIQSQAVRIAELEAALQIAKHNEQCTHDANVNLCKELAALRRKIDDAPAGWLECIPYERGCDHLDEFNEVGQAYADGWNACRKAMLAVSPKPGG
jgi:hypothetical protein